ncbi:MAG TPA: alpha/beta fold hydrolase [Anaerolineales bacterium]|jgi:phospholipase/carboxylesterase
MLFDALSLKHIARPPLSPTGKRPRLLLMLHGVGSNERDLFPLAAELDPRFYVLSLRGPYQLAPDQFGWYELAFTPGGFEYDPAQVEASRRKLAGFVDEAIEHYQAADRVYLFGFSQGATLSLTLLLTEPSRLAAVVAVAGRTLPELFQASTPLSGRLAEASELKGHSLFLAHGVADRISPVAYGRQASKLIERSPVDMTYREYDMDHTIGPQCLKEIAAWLGGQMA